MRLPAAAAHYLVRVLRVRTGGEIEVFDPRAGTSARATIDLDGEAIDLWVGPLVASEYAAPLVLVQGYPKGDKLADIVRDATEIGATLIVPAVTARSVARPADARADGRRARLERVAVEAARQCGRVEAPTVLPPMPWAEALGVARAHAATGFVLFERAKEPIRVEDPTTSIALCIGPEGGLEPDEVAAAEDLGFVARSLGSTILRTETAATVALGAIALDRARALSAGRGPA